MHDLTWAFYARGGLAMIPPAPDKPGRWVGREIVGHVLMLHINFSKTGGLTHCSLNTMADLLGMSRNLVYRARRHLVDVGYLVDTGVKDGQEIVYRVAVEAWPDPTRGGAKASVVRQTDPWDEVSVEGSVEVSVEGSVARQTRLDGIEIEGGTRARTREAPSVARQTPPPPCRKHPNGWNHRDPCGRCQRLREWDEAHPAPTATPTPRTFTTAWCESDTCDEVTRTMIRTDAAGRVTATRTPCPDCNPDSPEYRPLARVIDLPPLPGDDDPQPARRTNGNAMAGMGGLLDAYRRNAGRMPS